jgi:hypothetical protein
MMMMAFGSLEGYRIQHTKEHGSARYVVLFAHQLFMLLYFFGRLHFLTFFCPQKIKNPNYKGKWKIPWIDNPGNEIRKTNIIILNT